ncbi:hypothetical protein HXV88_02315 [Aeromonas veronii]|uniref:hypothetical protein n=1 Tax=Aeromonas veronii TaxID=654 RepID=UPI0015D0CC05|nr:hypothetical protein [Aeromonas veronii]QLH65363.1 hypothetical protein HXV88_02315 [Aeromonas veronii]
MMTSMHAFSASVVFTIPYASGQSAGTCTTTASELAPISVPRNIIVDNSVPNGTVLFSWDYSNFIPSISFRCRPSGILSSTSSTGFRFTIRPGVGSFNTATNSFNITSGFFNPGIGIRFYYTVTNTGSNPGTTNNPMLTSQNSSWTLPSLIPLNQEFIHINNNAGIIGSWIRIGGSDGPIIASRDQYDLKIRAELVKSGNITYGRLNFVDDFMRLQSSDASPAVNILNNVTGISAITLVPPQCRLSTPNSYSINLGRWVARGVGTLFPSATLPLVGTGVPLNIGLECNGGLNNVQFSFQDAGGTPQTNGSVGLYDSSSNKITGLEVEMRYNNTRINVGKSTDATSVLSKVSVGARTGGSGPYDNRTFTAATPAQFTAHFVQQNPITRGGVSYAGPVSGQVNIWVTYN